MIDPSHFTLFLLAALVLAVTPGPGILYVLARSLAGGRREGVFSSLGTLLGGLVHVVAAAAGLSTILATSALAFRMVKYAGAGYLIFLGVRMILTRGQRNRLQPTVAARGNVLLQGIATEVLNPKTALFFISFIPQFLDPKRGAAFGQFVLLGSVSVFLNSTADIVVALTAGTLGRRLLSSARARKRQRAFAGTAMIALGTYALLADADPH
jgi:threonine/homoserine/homoserine lactone efflux protein